MINNSAGYELDHRGVVLGRILNDTSEFIADSAQEISGLRQEDFIIESAKLLITDKDFTSTVYKSAAFIAGATTVVEALEESDLNQEIISQMQKHPLLQTPPQNLINLANDARLLAFRQEADRGIAAHPEIKKHLDRINGYFVAITKDLEYAQYARIGGGYYASMLDASFNAVMDRRVSDWIGQEVKLVDWDALI